MIKHFYTQALIVALLLMLVPLTFNANAQTFLDKSQWQILKAYDFNPGDNLSSDWIFTFPNYNNNATACPYYDAWNLQQNCIIDASGILHLKMAAGPYTDPNGKIWNYTGGMLCSNYTQPLQDCPSNPGGYMHGMFEIRCKMPKGMGFLPAFWLTGHDAWPPELDVFETDGKDPKEFFSTHHWVGGSPSCTGANCANLMTISSVGTQTFTMPAGWTIDVGQPLIINNSLANTYMKGNVISYNNTTGLCTLNVTSSQGSGTYNSWTICCERGDCSSGTNYHKQTGTGLDDEFHTYTLVWNPSEIAWFFDGKEIRTENRSGRMFNDCSWRRMSIIISLAFNCPSVVPSLNNHFLVDYVKVYSPTASNLTSRNYKQNNKMSMDNTSYLIDQTTSNATNVANSKFAIMNASNGIFYKGTDNRLWNYWWNGSSFVSNCLNWNVADLVSDLTIDQSNNRVYYKNSSNWLTYWDGSFHSIPSSNCAGSISANNSLSKVYYRGFESKIWNYYLTAPNVWAFGPVNTTNYDANVAGGICTNAAGSDLYYRGTDNNIWRISWNNNAWQAAVRLNTNGNVTDDMLYVESINKIYYRSTDNRIYNCYFFSGQWYTAPLSYASEDNDAIGNIAYDSQKGIVYYISNSGMLGHYYIDNDPAITNWYNSITNGVTTPNAAGPIVIRNDGTIFYRSTTGSMNEMGWRNGEIINPSPSITYSVYRTSYVDNKINNTNSIDNLKIKVYPNPSDQSLNFNFDLEESSLVSITIYDIVGRIVSIPVKDEYKEKGTHTYSFSDFNLSPGTYLFDFKTSFWSYKGTLVRN
ncbi:MAG TPA: family 16 glycosylhydrolase [Cytophagaceae bacterium]|jgi:beta-glucanase (GH16 family)|nr:family 16 glycosylhydrolase [Cytophagaceae bacterium]